VDKLDSIEITLLNFLKTNRWAHYFDLGDQIQFLPIDLDHLTDWRIAEVFVSFNGYVHFVTFNRRHRWLSLRRS
jgi:hypothetical protein